MKTTLSLSVLALSVLAAGCTGNDYGAKAKSPWTYEGSSGNPNPLTRAVTDSAAADPAVVAAANAPVKKYSWDKNKKAAKPKQQIEAPNEQGRLVVTEADDDYGVFSFKCIEKLDPAELYNVNDGRKAAKVRIVKIIPEGDNVLTVVADLLPKQEETPKFVVGSNLSYTKIQQ
ncbi:MAG: hypothetical protein LBT53_04000 [Puniceicoccales bacterium]|jgi:hypothetical protein|nr:hypothetical protein [Puniceicoccales bacterium]